MAITNEQTPVEPLFDPSAVGASLDQMFPNRREYLQGIRIGDVVAPSIGSGYEVDGVRQLVPGDDRRHINERATARNPEDQELLQLRQAEITPSLWIVTDVLQSRYDSNAGRMSKRHLGLSAIMSMAKMADAQGMPIGIIAATDRRIKADKVATSGQRHVLKIGHMFEGLLSEQADQTPEQKTIYLSDALNLASRLATRSAVLVVSGFRDVFDPNDIEHGWARSFTRVVRNGNDVSSIELTQPYNFELPRRVDIFRTIGRRTLNIAGKHEARVREHFKELAPEQQAAIDEELERKHVAHIELATNEPAWHSSLRSQLRKVAKQRVRR